MAGARITADQAVHAQRAIQTYGDVSKAARATGILRAALSARAAAINRPDIRDEVVVLLAKDPLPDTPRESLALPDAAPLAPKEIRDAEFWRHKAAKAEKALADVEHLAEQLAGLRETPTAPAVWSPRQTAKGSRSIIIAHTSDVHHGEVIRSQEIEGINAFNPDICRARMMRYFEAVCEIGPRWIADGECDGVLLTMGGDMISGDIHQELTATNALTSHESVAEIIGIYALGIHHLLEAYGKVHVVAVPGNHGRTTLKPQAKRVASTSYDILIASMLRQRIDDERVTWQIATGTDVRTPIYGKTLLTTHGDKIGTKGGMGFAGPVLPIVRGTQKIRLQSAAAQLGCDLILMGHYHTSAAPPGVLANGSVPGYSEFGNDLRAAVEPPQQWMARFSLHWGLADTLAVKLDDPGKPRVRQR